MENQKLTGILFIVFALLMQIFATIFASVFNFTHLMSERPGRLLTEFHAGGNYMIATWYFYALSVFSLFFAILTYKTASGSASLEKQIKIVGITSAVAQLIAVLRWTFLVPVLADSYVTTLRDTGKGSLASVMRFSLETIFVAQNRLLGLGIGRHLGQITLAILTVLIIRDQVGFSRYFRWLGYASAALLIAGLSDHFGVVFGIDAGILANSGGFGFILWSLWLVWLGAGLAWNPHLFSGSERRRSVPTQQSAFEL